MKTTASFHPATEQKLLTTKKQGIVEGKNLKKCERCGEPMLSPGKTCFRLTCSTEQFDSVFAPQAGKVGERELPMLVIDEDTGKVVDISAPAGKALDRWATHPRNWDAVNVGVSVVESMLRHMYPSPMMYPLEYTGKSQQEWAEAWVELSNGRMYRFNEYVYPCAKKNWFGRLGNCRLESEYGVTIQHRLTNHIQEFLLIADYRFKLDTLKSTVFMEREQQPTTTREFYSQEYESIADRHAAFEALKERLHATA